MAALSCVGTLCVGEDSSWRKDDCIQVVSGRYEKTTTQNSRLAADTTPAGEPTDPQPAHIHGLAAALHDGCGVSTSAEVSWWRAGFAAEMHAAVQLVFKLICAWV